MLKTYTRKKARLVHGDVLEWAANYKGPQFHALLCDPPYELAFMGKNWDKSGIAFSSDTWRLLAQHLLPGAFGMVFASARGYHRVACALENAGLEIYPSIFGFCFGSGFPKATRIDTQIDKKANVEREKIGKKKLWGHNAGSGAGSYSKNAYEGKIGIVRFEDITEPATDLAKSWEKYRYGKQSLKPALEPIIVFQKPYEGKPLDSITKHGSGALNIDDGRISTSESLNGGAYIKQGNRQAQSGDLRIGAALGMFQPGKTAETSYVQPQGRWPANFYVDEEAAKRLDKQSGNRPAGYANGNAKVGLLSNGITPLRRGNLISRNDSGGASRFFFNVESQIDESDPVFYTSKVSKKERNAGCESLVAKNVLGYELDHDKPYKSGKRNDNNLLQLTMMMTGKPPAMQKNTHPTLKPLSLCKWLATLLFPPGMYSPRRLLVPFSGTSSEMIGALQAGWDRVLGIEQEEEYIQIAKKRISYWIPRKG